MAITYPPSRAGLDGIDASGLASELAVKGKARDAGIPMQVIDCGDLLSAMDRNGLLVGGLCKFTFDFAADGPAPVGDFVLGNLPDGLIIRGGFIQTVTQTAGGTIALGYDGGDELLAAANPAAGLAAFKAGAPDDTVANYDALAADTELTMAVATGALTAGKFHVFLDVAFGG